MAERVGQGTLTGRWEPRPGACPNIRDGAGDPFSNPCRRAHAPISPPSTMEAAYCSRRIGCHRGRGFGLAGLPKLKGKGKFRRYPTSGERFHFRRHVALKALRNAAALEMPRKLRMIDQTALWCSGAILTQRTAARRCWPCQRRHAHWEYRGRSRSREQRHRASK